MTAPHGTAVAEARSTQRQGIERATLTGRPVDPETGPCDDGHAMKKWVGWVLLALCLWATYEGWTNSQVEPRTEQMSQPIACQGREGCTVEGDRPLEIRTDFLGRHYTWKTSEGPVKVSCGRAYVFAGEWLCTPATGS